MTGYEIVCKEHKQVVYYLETDTNIMLVMNYSQQVQGKEYKIP